jgi:hypothetical protein
MDVADACGIALTGRTKDNRPDTDIATAGRKGVSRTITNGRVLVTGAVKERLITKRVVIGTTSIVKERARTNGVVERTTHIVTERIRTDGVVALAGGVAKQGERSTGRVGSATGVA